VDESMKWSDDENNSYNFSKKIDETEDSKESIQYDEL
jgi:hypothetical protein